MLSPKNKKYLRSLTDSLANLQLEKITVLGHTGHIGTEAGNYTLSKKRTQSLQFKKQKTLIPGIRKNDTFVFKNIPKNKSAWMVAFKYEDNSAFLSVQEINTSALNIQPKAFKKVTLEELKSQLKTINI